MKKLAVLVTILVVQGLLVYAQTADILYSVHMADIGWGGYSSNGEEAGTTGQKRQIEAIKVRLSPGANGGVRYDTHVQDVGWTGWQNDDAISGTTGQKKRIEAIRVQLTGSLADKYDVRYQVHMANIGWSGWAMNGDDAGTTGQKRQLEAIKIVLVPKVSAGTGPLAVIQFEAESAVLSSSERAKLDDIASAISGKNIQIGGYTALAGTEAGRTRVSRARAQAVANYLVRIKAITNDNIVIREFGAENPVDDNSTKEGMKANRRAEIIILD